MLSIRSHGVRHDRNLQPASSHEHCGSNLPARALPAPGPDAIRQGAVPAPDTGCESPGYPRTSGKSESPNGGRDRDSRFRSRRLEGPPRRSGAGTGCGSLPWHRSYAFTEWRADAHIRMLGPATLARTSRSRIAARRRSARDSAPFSGTTRCGRSAAARDIVRSGEPPVYTSGTPSGSRCSSQALAIVRSRSTASPARAPITRPRGPFSSRASASAGPYDASTSSSTKRVASGLGSADATSFSRNSSRGSMPLARARRSCTVVSASSWPPPASTAMSRGLRAPHRLAHSAQVRRGVPRGCCPCPFAPARRRCRRG